eukprot:490556-Rhodomonas_salina.2
MKVRARVIFAALCTLLVAEGGWQGWHANHGSQAGALTRREGGWEEGMKRSISLTLQPPTHGMRLRGGADEVQKKVRLLTPLLLSCAFQ